MIPTFGVIKTSVLLFYRRLFAIDATFRRCTLALCIIVFLWTLSFFFAFTFQCGSHISYYWTSVALIEKYCVDTTALELGFAISDVITDIMILAVPQPILWRLKVSKVQRVALCGIFGLGLGYVDNEVHYSAIELVG